MDGCPELSLPQQQRTATLGSLKRYVLRGNQEGHRAERHVSPLVEEARYSNQYGRGARLPSRRWSFQFRLGLISRALTSLPKGAVVADIGCADGDYSVEIQRMGFRCIGIDRNPTRVLDGKRTYPEVDMIAALAARLAVKPAAVDGIVVINALRYFEPRTAAVLELHRILKKGGLLFILCHNADSPDIYLSPAGGAHYFTQSALASELASVGFEIAESGHHMLLPPFAPAQAGPLLDRFSRTRLASAFRRVYPEFHIVAFKA